MSISNVPVTDHSRNDRNYFRELEGVQASYYYNNLGQTLPFASSAVTWQTAALPTVTANTWTRAVSGLGFIRAQVGMKLEITNLRIMVTGACQVGLSITDDLTNTPSFILDSSTSNDNPGAYNLMVETVTSSTGGVVEFFRDGTPLVLRSGQRLDLWYTVTGTAGINWQATYSAMRLCDDDNFTAPVKMVIVSDSIGGFTGDPGAYPFCIREDGTITGSWPFIIKELAKRDAGIDMRIINKGIGGTTSVQWDWNFNQGRFRDIQADLWIINVGMNDASNLNNISTVAGTDGNTKKSIKNMVRCILRYNPDASIIINNITSTDTTIRLTTISGGKYNGYTQLEAYRADIREAVADINSANPTWDVQIAATDTAYLSSQYNYYIKSEQDKGAGNRLHPNTQLGQPAMAQIIYAKVKTSQFWQKNKAG